MSKINKTINILRIFDHDIEKGLYRCIVEKLDTKEIYQLILSEKELKEILPKEELPLSVSSITSITSIT